MSENEKTCKDCVHCRPSDPEALNYNYGLSVMSCAKAKGSYGLLANYSEILSCNDFTPKPAEPPVQDKRAPEAYDVIAKRRVLATCPKCRTQRQHNLAMSPWYCSHEAMRQAGYGCTYNGHSSTFLGWSGSEAMSDARPATPIEPNPPEGGPQMSSEKKSSGRLKERKWKRITKWKRRILNLWWMWALIALVRCGVHDAVWLWPSLRRLGLTAWWAAVKAAQVVWVFIGPTVRPWAKSAHDVLSRISLSMESLDSEAVVVIFICAPFLVLLAVIVVIKLWSLSTKARRRLFGEEE